MHYKGNVLIAKAPGIICKTSDEGGNFLKSCLISCKSEIPFLHNLHVQFVPFSFVSNLTEKYSL